MEPRPRRGGAALNAIGALSMVYAFRYGKVIVVADDRASRRV
jgi:hypothetical protein